MTQEQKPEEKKPQFVQRPMKLFNTLSKRKEHYALWLLTEYVTRWTVNWYDHEEVLLSDDEFCNGRRKANGERYDGGMPIKRTAAREYLAYAIENYYLEARDVGDPKGRKAWRLHPQFHPKTCSLYEQVEEEEGYITAKEGEPVRHANTTYSSGEQVPSRDTNRGYSPNAQVPLDGGSQEAARREPIETSYRDSFNSSIETLAPDVKIKDEKEEEEHKDGPTPEVLARAKEEALQREKEKAAAAKQAAENQEASVIAARLQGARSSITICRAALGGSSPNANGRDLVAQKLETLQAMEAALLEAQAAPYGSEERTTALEQYQTAQARYNAVREAERHPWQQESEG